MICCNVNLKIRSKKLEETMKYPGLLKIINLTYRFKELPQLQKNPKILNPGNQT